MYDEEARTESTVLNHFFRKETPGANMLRHLPMIRRLPNSTRVFSCNLERVPVFKKQDRGKFKNRIGNLRLSTSLTV